MEVSAHPKTNDLEEIFGKVIYKYTSEQAEEDGVLISIQNPLINTVINYITRNAFSQCIEPFLENWKDYARSKDAYASQLVNKLLFDAIKEMMRQGKKPDSFYSVEVRGFKFFIGLNETGRYTIMLPEDY